MLVERLGKRALCLLRCSEVNALFCLAHLRLPRTNGALRHQHIRARMLVAESIEVFRSRLQAGA